MRCPHCQASTLQMQAARQGTLVEVCSRCHGLWMEAGQIYEFSARPQELESQLEEGLEERQTSSRLCPRCNCNLEEGRMPDQDVRVDTCPNCGGQWFDAGEVERVVQSDDLLAPAEEPEGVTDAETGEKARDRLRDVAAGLLALPNLVLRSTLTLVTLYALLGIVLITITLIYHLNPNWVLLIGIPVVLLQFAVGPWIMDLSLRYLYKFSWVKPAGLPDHLRDFVQRVCAENGMKFPSFGLIHDGAPAAFTYGHHPSNARVVISQGILDLLEPAEVEAVVGHELGHARNWDMALMTLANLVPFLLYWLYRVSLRLGDRGKKEYTWAVYLGAYVLFIVSEYIVLWFSRTREYYADRFSGQVTGNPNALASALVKIAYGLAASEDKAKAVEAEKDKKKKKAKKAEIGNPIEAFGALNIFDRKGAVGLVMASARGTETGSAALDVEQVKGAMQWDLWNPWATYYELHSTHPLVAKRLLYLTDQAAHQGQDPLVVFDRRKPESYWDEFFVDLSMMVLPTMCFLLGVAACIGALLLFPGIGLRGFALLAAGVGLAGIGSLLKTRFVYRWDFFPHQSVAALLHKVKVSAVRPVPATLTGTIIGKGVPGLIWSEDFVLKDKTGIIFLDYRQPFALWDWLFGLLRAGRYQGKEVRVRGWYRRAPVPYLELERVEVLNGSQPKRHCYSYHARVAVGVVLAAFGFAAALLLLFAR